MPDTTATFVDPQVAFLYASQTGNAESISYNLYEDAVKRGYNASWHVLDDHQKFDFNSLRTAIFVVSTTGDGDPPDNSTKFWRALRKSTRSNPSAYSHLRYAILGLGDTNYSNFCNTAMRLDRQLTDSGATSFYAKGLADDGTGLEEVVEPWIDGLWPALAKIAHCNSGSTVAENEGSDKLDVIPSNENSEAADNADSAAAAIEKLAVSDKAAPTSISELPTHTSQPLVLDFSPLATLKAISGAPRVPASVCTISHLDNTAETTFRVQSVLPHNLECPPWYTDLTSQKSDGAATDEQDKSLAPFLATIKASKQITTTESLKRTLLVDFDISDSTADHVRNSWQAGDAFNIFAPNDIHMVSALFGRLDVSAVDGQRPILLSKKDEKIELPAHLQRFSTTPASMHDMFVWAIDVTSAPRKQLLRVLADHCSESAERDRLLYLSSRQGTKTFEELRRQSPTLVDTLHAFPSCKPPVERLIELLPPLVPRSYSICNAPQSNPSLWRIAFNVVEYELEVVDPFSSEEDGSSAQPVKISRHGVCTPWLEQISCKRNMPKTLVAKRPNISGFRLPLVPSGVDQRPVLMIGPGTGVAPFIGFLEQRAKELGTARIDPLSEQAPLTWLFFGCRNSKHDYLFKEDIEHWQKSGVLSRLSLCFSRDPQAREQFGAPKYVQDAMMLNEAEIADLLINKNALVYVCGDAKGMGKDVNSALADILCSYTVSHPECVKALLAGTSGANANTNEQQQPLTLAQALQVLMRWSTERRYLRDLWA
ncbi:hypothetical protein GGI25_001108 [Coemansia spiralis]|uniref:Methionine synthase reductase n=2 Tax=Coemansia TaxID=4863 RepID=A0A9W8KZT5_9FUNG|nr:hypothetical protein EDC05_000778 [Coemansia umbellata]KAJ2625128.1 hypothetical protein GGI26_000931 [Coemansia sp. RSA 1358]KAJ2679919.1 hypothetical protein GGI25_001108 [Coemansia spiralis]